MRTIVPIFFALLLASCPSIARAQVERKQPPEIKKVQIGYKTFHQREDDTAYKVGLWTPIYVEVFGGADGIEAIVNGEKSHLEILSADTEEVGTVLRVPVAVDANKSRTFISYIKPGQAHGDARVTLHIGGRRFTRAAENSSPLRVDSYLFLTLGQKLTFVHRAAHKLGRLGDDKEKLENERVGFDEPRQVLYETEVERLPEAWYGYQSVDLMFLATDNRRFLTELNKSPERLKALAQWVRRGGRLVIPIAHQNQDIVATLLQSEAAWQPPIPVVPPRSPGNVQELALDRLSAVEDFGGVQGMPFDRKDGRKVLPIEVALLTDVRKQAPDWEVFAASDENSGSRPLIARVRYGLGQITYMAFSFGDVSFIEWKGNDQFIQSTINKLGPRSPTQDDNPRMVGRGDGANDLATDLIAMLDNFDVKIIPFGLVALFIVLYILVVGPLDFFLLKHVFKRLEWTWITFPAVVLGISVIAYFAAYTLKGRDLKINKVDVVDFDLRTSRDEKQIHAYGNSFFTILSPRIQNYTIGLEPNAEFWGEEAGKVRSVDLMGWLGRPSGGPNDMRRGGSTGLFRKPYEFTEDITGVKGVPIPVWTTKAFCASWEQTLKAPPFTADLVYHTKEFRGKDLKITGKLASHLGVDLVDVWMLHQDRCYPIAGGLKSVKRGGPIAEFVMPATPAEDPQRWVNKVGDEGDRALATSVWSANMPPKMKQFLFNERVDTQNKVPNHLFRTLDLGWRVGKEHRREAILFGRVRFAAGGAEDLTRDAAHPLPTKLWLSEIPDDDRKTRPALPGQLNQDIYVRVILPVRAADE